MQRLEAPNRTKTILFAGILLGGYIALLIGLVYLGQQQLRQSLSEQAHLAIEKQAAAAGFFFAEQEDEIRELAKHPVLNNFFANRALGMSMQYGLRASLLAVRDELNRLLTRKKLQGRSIFSQILFVDDDGSILAATGEEVVRHAPLPSLTPHSEQAVSLHILRNENNYSAYFTATIDYSNQVAGLIVAKTNLVEVLTPLLKQKVNDDVSNRLTLLGPEGEILISAGESRSVFDPDDHQEMITKPIPGSDYSLRGTIELAYGQGLLTSAWFLVALFLIALPVLGGVYYLLRLNTNHILLQERYLSSRQQQRELHRFRTLLNLSSDLIVMIDPETSKFLDVNQTMCDFFRLSREELLQKRVIDISGRYRTMAQWRDFLSKLKRRGRMSVEDNGRQPSGEGYIIEVNAHYATSEERDSIVAIIRDISERKKTELALKRSSQRVAAVLDGIDAAVYVADMATHEVLYINPKVREQVGDVVGAKCWQTLQTDQTGPCSYCTNNELLDAQGKPTGTYTWEFHNPMLDRWYHCSDRAIPWDDGRYVRLQVATDITSRIEDVRALREAHQQLASQAHYDPLTKLANRRLFSSCLTKAFARADRTQSALSVCYLDLDGFKHINDTLGHEVGDALLMQVASRLKNGLRDEDTVARWGGDEFALLITDQENMEASATVLERLLKSLAAPYELEGRLFHVTSSIGVTMYPQDSGDPDTLLRHADQAMYVAKQRGRNRYYFFDPDRDRQIHARRAQLNRIEKAIEGDELRLFYQPKVDMAVGKVIGAEALVRWQHPDEGLLPPAAFLPMIEDHEIQYALDKWVLTTAVKQAARWRAEGLGLSLSINLSPKTMQQVGFIEMLKRLIEESTIDSSQIELEILENNAIDDLDAVSSIIQQCAEFGVSFALDDYGTGYSSLSYIRRLPVQTLKIDQSFVRDMLKDQEDFNIVAGVIGLAKVFERKVIAEGVEDTEIGIRLLELGCNLAQGYGIARPMPESEFIEWVGQYRIPMEWFRASKDLGHAEGRYLNPRPESLSASEVSAILSG